MITRKETFDLLKIVFTANTEKEIAIADVALRFYAELKELHSRAQAAEIDLDELRLNLLDARTGYGDETFGT